jgi:phthalate 3,4-dioxygenase beta subunit
MTVSDGGHPAVEDAQLYFEAVQFLNHEASLLDSQRYGEWLELLNDDIRYTMPVRVTVVNGQEAPPSATELYHFDEDHYSLAKRVERLGGDRAWTENPPSRTRRFVTNVSVMRTDEADEFACTSYLLLFRSRLDIRPPEWVSAKRSDLLRRREGSLRIVDRRIEVDESVIRTQNLAIFL